jgi:16S rRNA (guanine527-N7)-methyltransferase
MDTDETLIETLRDAQRLGFFGPADVAQAADHAHEFVAAIGALAPGTRVIDIGSGGGLPGLVVAAAMPHVDIVLVDRRQKRTDFLQRAVRRLGYTHVSVVTADVAEVARAVSGGSTPFDVVTARGFGPPDVTLTLARRLTRVGGLIIISEPPTGNRWDAALLQRLDVSSERVGAVRRFVVTSV